MMKSLTKIKTLLSVAKKFKEFNALYDEKYEKDSHCDKKGFGFNRDNRFSAFKINTSFDSWAGYNGNSNCGRILHIGEVNPFDLNEYFNRALNIHQQELFATVATLMEDDAYKLFSKAREEIDTADKLLESLDDRPWRQ